MKKPKFKKPKPQKVIWITYGQEFGKLVRPLIFDTKKEALAHTSEGDVGPFKYCLGAN